jgi:hypothetical protein
LGPDRGALPALRFAALPAHLRDLFGLAGMLIYLIIVAHKNMFSINVSHPP